MDSKDWVTTYSNEQPKYEKYTNKLSSLIHDLLIRENIEAIIEKRTKSVESFKKKINRPDKNYKNPLMEITDLTGIRLILKNLNDVDEAYKIIEDNFEIDYINSVDKADDLKHDRFGYLSVHLIFRLNKSRSDLDDWSDLKGLWAEIQIRTVLQHAWAGISHFLDYKNEFDVPTKFKRKLYCISAVLELTDSNLNSLINDIYCISKQYKQDIHSKKLNIELNKESLTTYFDNSKTFNYWKEVCKPFGFQVFDLETYVSEDLELLKYVKIKTIEELDNVLENSKGWGENYLKELFSYLSKHRSLALTMILSRFIIRALIFVNFMDKFPNNEIYLFEFNDDNTLEIAKKYNLRLNKG